MNDPSCPHCVVETVVTVPVVASVRDVRVVARYGLEPARWLVVQGEGHGAGGGLNVLGPFRHL